MISDQASLSQRLCALQIPTSGTTESLDHLRLEDLAAETISFGQKHQGHIYLEAWEDQEWVQLRVSRYQGSTKDSHRRFLKFVVRGSATPEEPSTSPARVSELEEAIHEIKDDWDSSVFTTAHAETT